MKMVSGTLGHVRSSVTADVYASAVFKEAAEAAAAMVLRRVGPQRETSGPPDLHEIKETAG